MVTPDCRLLSLVPCIAGKLNIKRGREGTVPMNFKYTQPAGSRSHAGHVLCSDTAILHYYGSCMETSK